MDHAKLMTQAAMLRKQFGVDDYSPVNINTLVQSIEKLTVVYYPMGDNLSGLCIKGPEENSLIAVNSTMTSGRQNFSLAHELYHLYFDDSTVSLCELKAVLSGNEIERSADMFASYFLMPEASLLTMAKELCKERKKKHLSLDDLIRIEQYYGASHQATVYRLMGTPYLSRIEGERFLDKSVRRRAEILGFSSDLYRPLPDKKQYMTYGSYIDSARKLLEKELVSPGKYEELLLDAFRSDLVYGDDEETGDIID